MSEARPQPRSPCISVCLLDENDICKGCYRSADEITDWSVASVREKHEILQRARRRLEVASPVRLL